MKKFLLGMTYMSVAILTVANIVTSDKKNESDSDKLANDWKAVGNDIKKGIENYGTETQRSK